MLKFRYHVVPLNKQIEKATKVTPSFKTALKQL